MHDIYYSGALQRQLRMPTDRHFHWTASPTASKPGPAPPMNGKSAPTRTRDTERLSDSVSILSISDGEDRHIRITTDSQQTVPKSDSEEDSRYTRKSRAKNVFVADSEDESEAGSEEGEISSTTVPKVNGVGQRTSKPSAPPTPSRMSSSERQKFWASKSGRTTPIEEEEERG